MQFSFLEYWQIIASHRMEGVLVQLLVSVFWYCTVFQSTSTYQTVYKNFFALLVSHIPPRHRQSNAIGCCEWESIKVLFWTTQHQCGEIHVKMQPQRSPHDSRHQIICFQSPTWNGYSRTNIFSARENLFGIYQSGG